MPYYKKLIGLYSFFKNAASAGFLLLRLEPDQRLTQKQKGIPALIKAGISAFAFLVLLKCLVVFQNRKIKAKRYIVIFVCTSISNIRILFNLRQIYKSFPDIYPFLLKKVLFFLFQPQRYSTKWTRHVQ